MEEEKRKPGRPRKWASDAERMRAARAAKRENRLAEEARKARLRVVRGRAVSSPRARSADETGLSETAPRTTGTTTTGHAHCEAIIGALRTELLRVEEGYDDLVLSWWVLAQKHERALSRMRSHDPAGIAWLVEQLAEWERDVEARRTKRLQEPNRERARRRCEEEFERRLELARRESPE